MKTGFLNSRPGLRLLALIILLLCPLTVVAQSWFDNDWPFRVPVSISNQGTTSLSDYQVNVIIRSESFDFSKASINGSDLRFIASDGTTPIPFWIESWVNGDTASIWLKMPSIPVEGTNVFMYYGNTDVTSLSNGSETFDFFDDFENWEVDSQESWQNLSELPTPSADLTAAVWSNKLYTFGGYGTSSASHLNTVYEYDPVTDIWSPKANMPTARWGMVAVEFEGKIYVFGGQGIDNDRNEVYDPGTDSWETRSPIPAALAQQGLMGIKYGDRIHLFYRAAHYAYDPYTDTYTQRADVPTERTWCTVSTVGGMIYIIGGYSYEAPTGATNVNEMYNPMTDTWTSRAVMPVSRYGITRENPVINDKIYVTHGLSSSFFTDNYEYDPATDSWTERESAVYARDGVACGVISNKLYVVGGRNVLSGPFGVNWVEVYDPSLDTDDLPSGASQWTTSGSDFVFAAEEAKYQGYYGLEIRQPTDGSIQRFAQTLNGYGSTFALDFDWCVTDGGGYSYIVGGNIKPQSLVTLSEGTQASLFYYNFSGTPSLRWFSGAFATLTTTGSWNNWHRVSVTRNGTESSRVLFDGILYDQLGAAPAGGTGRIQFGVYFATTQYIDNVRVRKWSGADLTAVVGDEEQHATQWTGDISGDWNDPDNWTIGVPGPGSEITIPGGPIPIIFGGSMTINLPASLTINPGGALTVTGDLICNGPLTINSTLVSSGSLIANGTSTGNISFNRQLIPGSTAGSDWHLAAPPVSVNSSTNTGKITAVYLWSEPTGLWTATGITSVVAGRGYNINQEPSSDGVITFTGPIANGNVTYDASSPFAEAAGADVSYFDRTYVAGRSPGNQGGRGWNLLGNPYPSAISAESFILANYNSAPGQSQFDPNHVALYLFDGTTRGYYYIARSTGWPSGTELGETHIQAGQGFFVMAMSDNSVFTFTKAMQEHSTGTPMLKSTVADDGRWPGLQLKVKYASGELVTTVVYEGSMTTGVDPGYDIGLFKSGQEIELYTLLALKDNGINYTSQALPLSGADTLAIPVGVDFKKGGDVTFSAITVPVDSRRFWLSDKVAGTFTELGLKSYTVNLPPDTYGTGRFYIIASANTPTGMRDPESSLDNLRIWVSGGRLIIRGTLKEGSLCEIFDIQGRKLMERKLSDGELNTIDLSGGMHGVLAVKVTDGDIVVTRKVVVP